LDPDHRGVIAVDGIGPVEIRLHRLDVIQLAAAPNGERGDHRMRQRVRHDAVDNGSAT
jgi:hypothetical protein